MKPFGKISEDFSKAFNVDYVSGPTKYRALLSGWLVKVKLLRIMKRPHINILNNHGL